MKALAIDLGGSHAACAVVGDVEILAVETLNVAGSDTLAGTLPQLAEALRRVAQRAEIAIKDCGGLAFGFPGLVDTGNARVLSTNGKYSDARRVDLAAWSRDELGVGLRLENDARLALLGEHYAGAARGFGEAVMITLGTGVGTAAMIGGRILRGKHSQAGCLGGHVTVNIHGRVCNCGNVGCVEAEASTAFLPDICRGWRGFDQSGLASEEKLDYGKIFAYAAEGDCVAREVLEHSLRVWAAGAISMIHSYDPEVVVFGGGIVEHAARYVIPFITEQISRHAWTGWGEPKVRAAELGNNAALLGAIPLLREP